MPVVANGEIWQVEGAMRCAQRPRNLKLVRGALTLP
nr:hypothetical protein [Pseudoalteromonas rubra]